MFIKQMPPDQGEHCFVRGKVHHIYSSHMKSLHHMQDHMQDFYSLHHMQDFYQPLNVVSEAKAIASEYRYTLGFVNSAALQASNVAGELEVSQEPLFTSLQEV